MDRPVPTAPVLFVAVVLLGWTLAAGSLLHERRLARQMRVALRGLTDEADRLAAAWPSLNPENEQAIAGELVAAEAARVELRAAVGVAPENEPNLTSPLDGFFEISHFIERSRTAAAAARVSVRAGEHFGFASYAQQGPPPAELARVGRQRQAAGDLLKKLLAARPRALLALQREWPGPPVPGSAPAGPDYFVPEQNRWAAPAGGLESILWRVEFTGRTATLRKFLAALAGSSRFVFVRSVTVEPHAPATPPAPAGQEKIALVHDDISRFVVVVEYFALAATGEPLPS